ncbi:hypothetical protein LEMLEM_LOCUS10095, partial [Lemmus lemmus]
MHDGKASHLWRKIMANIFHRSSEDRTPIKNAHTPHPL